MSLVDGIGPAGPAPHRWPGIVTVAAFVIVVAGMRAAESVLVPFLLSVFIAVISAPALFWLEKRRLPRWLALTLVITGVVAALGVVGAVVGTSLTDFSRELPVYRARAQEETTQLIAWLGKLGVEVSSREILKYVDPGAALSLVSRMLNGLGGVLSNAFLIFLTVVFILFEAESFPAKLRRILRDPEVSLARFGRFAENLKRYLAIKTLASFATGAIIAIWLAVVGVDYPVLWGLLAFLLNYIPNIGSIIAAVPAVLFAWIGLGGGAAVWTAIAFVAVNNVIGNVIEPRFMGRGVGLSTLVVFVSLVFWGWLLGPVGMFLSVPLTMTAKIALDSSEDTRWLAVLLGPDVEPVAPSPAAPEPEG